MNVLVATGLFPPDIGGPAMYAKLLSEELPRRGISTKILSFGTVRKYPKGIRHLLFLFKLLWCAWNADVIFAQDTVSVGLPATLAAAVLRKKFFLRVPGDYAWEQAVQRYGVTDSIDVFQNTRYGRRVERLRRIQRWVAARADCIITPSEYFRTLVSAWVAQPEKVVRIYNGINTNVPLVPKQEARAHVSVSPQDILVVSAGRLVPWKGFEPLVEVVASLKNQAPWRLVIAGDGPEKEPLFQYVRSLHAENVVKLTGALSQDQLCAYLRAADIFVLNTEFESFSFQTVQAMSQGVPVVLTDIGNLREIVTDGVEGVLVPVHNNAALSEALVRLGSNPELRTQMGQAGERRAQNFSIKNTVDQLVELFRKHNV